MWNRIKQFLLYGNLNQNQFKKVESLVFSENAFTLRLASVVQILYFGASFIGSMKVTELADKRLVYGIGTMIPLIVLIVHLLLSKKYPKLVSWLVRIFSLGALVTALLCTLVCTPDELTILLLIFFFCIPMLFVMPPIELIVLFLATDIIYSFSAPSLKTAEILTMDMIDVITFSTLAVILGISHMQGRYRRYWLETEAIDLAQVRYRAAFIDQLTGVFNRNAYNKDTEGLDTSALKSDFMMLALDLNGLKAANDSFGHVAGDELIVGAANCMRKCFDSYGTVYRVGGDEFIVMLNAKDKSEGEILKDFNDTIQSWHGALVDKLSISYGVVRQGDSQGKSFHELELLADKRMYQSKSDYYKNSGLDRRKN